jgi:pSer/pThr/pTyr-binding forkhead associated (FHA) protein
MIPKTTWLIGSSPDCDLVVEQPSVTWFHCRLSEAGDGYLLEDLGSTNGTFVNGQKLTVPARVDKNDRVTLGLTVPMPWPEKASSAPKSGPQGKTVFRVGRDPDNDIVIDNAEVSSVHARVLVAPGKDRGEVEDLGSTNGTSLNSVENHVTHATFTRGDTLYFGPVPVPASRFLGGPVPEPEPADGIPRLRFTGALQTIGRDSSCDIVVETLVVSGRHARLIRSGTLLVIEDLRSSNGTFVNGRRISEPTPVKHGDLIGLGAHTMRLVDGEAPAATMAAQTIGSVYHGASPTTAAALTPIRLLLLAAFAIQPLLVAVAAFALAGLFAPGPEAPTVSIVLAETMFALSLGSVWLGLLGSGLLHAARLHPPGREGSSLASSLATTLALGAGALLVATAATVGLISLRVSLVGDGFAIIALAALTAFASFCLGRVLIGLTGRLTVASVIAGVLFFLMAGLGGPRWPLTVLNPVVRSVTGLFPSRWGFEGLLLLNTEEATPDDPTRSPDDLAEPYFPAETERTGTTTCATALVLIVVGLILAETVISASERERLRQGTGS